MQIFLILSTLVFGLLFVVWSHSSWKNTFIKAVFFALFVYGLIVSLYSFGYIIKV